MESPDPTDSSLSARDAARAAHLARIPGWYSPWAHLAFPSLVGLGLGAVALASLHAVRPDQWLTIPITFIAINAAEWRVHRDVLHRPLPLLRPLYQRHTPDHHRLYVTADMAIRSVREFRMVLLPAWAILIIAAMALPIALALRRLEDNVAALLLATAMAYYISYVWYILTCHFPI